MLINNDTHQRQTLSERSIRLPLRQIPLYCLLIRLGSPYLGTGSDLTHTIDQVFVFLPVPLLQNSKTIDNLRFTTLMNNANANRKNQLKIILV